MDAYSKAPGLSGPQGFTSAQENRVRLDAYTPILATDQVLLVRRIDSIRQQDLTAAAVKVGLIIDLAPSCPRWASRRVDQLTVIRDRRLGVEVAA